MAIQFKARAKNPQRCAWLECHNTADKIYVNDDFKILACSQAHAELVDKELSKLDQADLMRYIKTYHKITN